MLPALFHAYLLDYLNSSTSKPSSLHHGGQRTGCAIHSSSVGSRFDPLAAILESASCAMLPTTPPTPAASAPQESDNEEQHDRADRGIENQTDDSGSEMDIEARNQAISNERAYQSDDDVADESETGPAHDLTC